MKQNVKCASTFPLWSNKEGSEGGGEDREAARLSEISLEKFRAASETPTNISRCAVQNLFVVPFASEAAPWMFPLSFV